MISYFLPGLSGNPPREELLRQFPWLAYAFPKGMGCATVGVSTGPTGGSGVIAGVNGDGLGYYPERQNWNKIPGSEVCFSVPKDQPVKPGQLMARSLAVDGQHVQLGDGNAWLIPIVRFVMGGTNLPCVLKQDDQGKIVKQPKPEFSYLIALAEKIWEADVNVQGAYAPEALFEIGRLALGVNYRVGAAEISSLNLLDTENVRQICGVLLDGENFKALCAEFAQKKTDESTPGMVSEAGASV